MIIRNASLETVCGVTSILPENILPEIAFAGKSNVGKSTLINTLLNRKSLARTSSSPGKTQTLNFYLVNESFFLVDLPGYGYAKTSRTEVEKWGVMIERYLNTSVQLKAVFLLIDIRHGPGSHDLQMFDWIVRCGFVPVIIATKADKISRLQIKTQTARIREMLPGPSKEQITIIPFSSVTREGKEQILDLMERFAGLKAPEYFGMSESAGEETAEMPDDPAKRNEKTATADGTASVQEQGRQKNRWPKERKKTRKKTDQKKSGKKTAGKRKKTDKT